MLHTFNKPKQHKCLTTSKNTEHYVAAVTRLTWRAKQVILAILSVIQHEIHSECSCGKLASKKRNSFLKPHLPFLQFPTICDCSWAPRSLSAAPHESAFHSLTETQSRLLRFLIWNIPPLDWCLAQGLRTKKFPYTHSVGCNSNICILNAIIYLCFKDLAVSKAHK